MKQCHWKTGRAIVAALCGLSLYCLAQSASQAQSQERRGPEGRGNRGQAPLVGMHAPTFEVQAIEGEERFDLREFRDKRPVILFFGSYT